MFFKVHLQKITFSWQIFKDFIAKLTWSPKVSGTQLKEQLLVLTPNNEHILRCSPQPPENLIYLTRSSQVHQPSCVDQVSWGT